MLNKKKVLRNIYRYTILLIGLFIYSISFNLFLSQYNFVTGGVSGISIIVKSLLNINEPLTVMVLSIILLIIGFILCNKDRMYSSVAATFISPLFLEMTSGLTDVLDVNISPLLAALYCAILTGVALGIVFKVGFSTGGTDIIYWISERFIKKSTGQIMLMVEGVIVLAGAFVFGFEKLMYSLIILYLTSKISDMIVIGISDSKLVCVIPEKIEAVSEYLNSVSFVKSFRVVTDNNKDVIYCVLASKDYRNLYNNIKAIDKKAFLSANNTYETMGGLKYE